MSAHLARSPSYQGSDPDTKDVAYPDEKEIGVAKVEPVKFSDLNDGVSRDRGLVGKLWQIVEKVDKFGVEARGIERVPPNERGHTSALDNLWMWTAVNCTISTFSLGTLGASVFELGFRDAVLTIIFFNLLSTLPVAYFATWGAKLGLRQMTIGRFSFGYWTAYFPIILNMIACIGWSCINSIVGGQTLQAVNTDQPIPEAVAIVIIALMTLVVSFMGYKVVHLYERYSWIPAAIIFLIILGQSAKYMETGPWGGSGSVEAASVLSFGSSIVGFGLGWSSLAADYTVNQPENSNPHKIFWLTYVGLNVPLILVETLGAAMMTTFAARPDWGDAYNTYGVGGLLAAGLSPAHGFGKFCLVLLALSIVGNNVPNIYSLALTAQNLGPWVQAIPRMFITLIGTAVYIVLAIVGASHFESWLNTLLVLLSYWLAIYSTILLEEHFIFRGTKFSRYNVEEVGNWRKLPLGLAAFFALGLGIMGAVFGMAQTWYVGILARKIGLPEFGGDIGFELSAAFAAVSYPVFRYVEKKYWGY